MTTSKSDKEQIAASLEHMAEQPGVLDEFIVDLTEYANVVWGYEPDVALAMARKSAKERDHYFALWAIGLSTGIIQK